MMNRLAGPCPTAIFSGAIRRWKASAGRSLSLATSIRAEAIEWFNDSAAISLWISRAGRSAPHS
ncbi:MAG TPA: hypothetical protein VKA70_11035 [Blastocatellia bacterium]|nr:hypothetical protein [Blastocatellia bacterium]